MLFRSLVLLLITITLAACQNDGAPNPKKLTLRLGYFPNVTHSQALIGLARGDFQNALGESAQVKPILFNAGPAVIEALFAEEIDLSYVGPNPAINGYMRSHGQALRIIAGATSGGASLVVSSKAKIKRPKDLSGKRIATPQLGNTQDVALRSFLERNGLRTREKGGDVEVLPMPNAQILDMFKQGEIQGAWVPEPWATRLVSEFSGVRLVDERDLWPNKAFVTTELIARTAFLEAHPDLVKRLLAAHVAITAWSQENPTAAQAVVNARLKELTGKSLDPAVLAQSWDRLLPTWDPLTVPLHMAADAAFKLGFLKEPPALKGIYALELLNRVLSEKQLPRVAGDPS